MPRSPMLHQIAAAALGLLAATSPAAGQAPARIDAREAQEDFDVLHRALAEAHGGYTRFASRSDLDRRMAAHRARLARPVSRLELAGVLSEMIAELRDGHARLELDSLTASALSSAALLPLRVSLEQDRLLVRLNDSPTDQTIAPGMEIVSINGRTAAAVFGILKPTVSSDGFIETGRHYRIALEFARLYWLHVEQTATYTVVARDASGREVAATMQGVTDLERRTVSNPVNAAMTASMGRLDGPPGRIALQFLDGGRVGRLRIRGFDGQTFLPTLDSAFQELRVRGTPSLILDLRGNGGGVDEYGASLVSYFVDAPFRYFDRIHVTTIAPSFATWLPRTFDAMKTGTIPDPAGGFLVTSMRHSGVGEQQPAPNGFRGRVVVLIDGGSFSTTTDVAAHLRSRQRAVFVGEETAGTYEGNTSGLNALIVLPNSGLRLRVMMYGYWNAVTPVPGGRGVIPDYQAPWRVADVLAGSDHALEMAITLARQ